MSVELTAWAHTPDDSSVYMDPAALGAKDGDIAELVNVSGGKVRNLYFRICAKPLTNAVSVSSAVLQQLDIQSRQTVTVRAVSESDRKRIEIDVVELKFKGVLLTRNDHYKIAKWLHNKCVFKGQRVSYLHDKVRLSIDTIFRGGKMKFSGFIGTDTRVVFRSDSAKVYIFIQLSSEMWNFDETGDIMFHRLINSFLPEMLHRWHDQGDSHLVSIVFFTSISNATTKLGAGKLVPEVQNFYRVVVDSVHISRWSDIMQSLRYEFTRFPKEVLVNSSDGRIKGHFLPATKGNLLEAIALATTLLTNKFVDKDLWRSGAQALFATAGPACYDVDLSELYKLSKQLLGVEIGIEMLCLARAPLHVAPLFRALVSKSRPRLVFCVPTWINLSFWTPNKFLKQWIPQCRIYDLQMVGLLENKRVTLDLSFDLKQNIEIEYMKAYDANVFTKDEVQTLRPHFDCLMPVATTAMTYLVATHSPNANSQTTNFQTTKPPTINSQTTSTTSSTQQSVISSQPIPLVLGNSVIRPQNAKLSFNSQSQPQPQSVSSSLSPSHSRQATPVRPQPFANTKAFKVERRSVHTQGPEHMLPSMWRVLPNAATVDNPTRIVEYGRWANVYPPKRQRAVVSWHSLKSPAALPLTSESFPDTRTLNEHYKFQFYDVAVDPETMDIPEVLDEMIGQRLNMGFQISVGPKVRVVEASFQSGHPNMVCATPPELAKDCIGIRIYLTRTGLVHRLAVDDDHTINVRLYAYEGFNLEALRSPSHSATITQVKTKYDKEYHVINSHFWDYKNEHMNWSMLDQQIGGMDDPFETVSNANDSSLVALRYVLIPIASGAHSGLTQEETHLEGVTKLVRALQKRCGDTTYLVHYYTGSLSNAVNEMLLDSQNKLVQNRLMKDISLQTMAAEMQGKLGLILRDRRWHFANYRGVFTGNEFARWLQKTFQDINTLGEATEYAQQLMDRGLFKHVLNRHKFINGHYFYEMAKEYKQDSEQQKNGPITTSRVHVSESFVVNVSPEKVKPLSERVKISVDRLHNPKNTFHVLVEWLNATPKLVDDMFNSFARLVAPYGLKLVQVAVADVQGSIENSPFKTAVHTECCLENKDPLESKRFLQFVMRKYMYVLDIHDRDDSKGYDAFFTWGRVQSKYSQFIHQSGYVLMQLTGGMGVRIAPNTLHISRAVMTGQPAESESEALIDAMMKLLSDRTQMEELKKEFLSDHLKSDSAFF